MLAILTNSGSGSGVGLLFTLDASVHRSGSPPMISVKPNNSAISSFTLFMSYRSDGMTRASARGAWDLALCF